MFIAETGAHEFLVPILFFSYSSLDCRCDFIALTVAGRSRYICAAGGVLVNVATFELLRDHL